MFCALIKFLQYFKNFKQDGWGKIVHLNLFSALKKTKKLPRIWTRIELKRHASNATVFITGSLAHYLVERKISFVLNYFLSSCNRKQKIARQDLNPEDKVQSLRRLPLDHMLTRAKEKKLYIFTYF